LPLGFFENFPSNIHLVQTFNSMVPIKHLQEKLIQVLYEANKKEFSFEEAANPTIPHCTVIFEFGLADAQNFNYIDEEEVKKLLNQLATEPLHTIDFFCAVRYYKNKAEKKTPLKFDYYLLRTVYQRDLFEIQVHHKKGPRYLSPEDLTLFIFNKTNEGSKRKVLKKAADN